MTKKLQTREEYFIQFTDEEMLDLGMEKGQKFTVKTLFDGSIKLVPFSEIEIDLNEFSREELISLLNESCETDLSVNEVISNRLKRNLDLKNELE
ncbi:MAG: hypothetical protein WC390_06565 [Sulfurimonas sp.]|jgi:hypothetical protein